MTEILRRIFDNALSYADCGHDTAIVDVDPDLAQDLLDLNFAQNRTASKEHIDRFATDMKNGEWILSNDAIVLSDDMQVGNAQHRLQAVIQSGTTQRFIVLFGSDKGDFQKLDTGKKRTMEQRITISGIPISQKECSIVRHAMNDYTHPHCGTVEFGYQRHDAAVAEIYLKHKEFLKATNAQKPAGPSFFWAAALKMYAEMVHFGDYYTFKHDHSPLTRARLFIDLCVNGHSDISMVGPHEVAAIKLRNLKEARKQTNIGFSDKNALQFTITAAYKFMTGETVKALQRPKSDPFHSFLHMESTNSPDYVPQ